MLPINGHWETELKGDISVQLLEWLKSKNLTPSNDGDEVEEKTLSF